MRRRTVHRIVKNVIFAAILLATTAAAIYYGLQARENYRGLRALARFEALMAKGSGDTFSENGGRKTEILGTPPPQEKSVLIVQHMPRNGALERASARSHAAYARAWGYGHSLDYTQYVKDGRFKHNNKLYTLQTAMKAELAKAPQNQSKWLLWCDADTIVRDPSVPIHVLLPPETLSPTPHLIGNEDHKGFNSGVMLLRVGPHAAGFIDELVTIIEERKDINWPDQTRIHTLLRSAPHHAQHFYRIPKTWMNAYWLHETGEPWSPQLHVHFVAWLKDTFPFRPVLEHAADVVEAALSRREESGENSSIHQPYGSHVLQTLPQTELTRAAASAHWASAVGGISGMRFLDEVTLEVFLVD